MPDTAKTTPSGANAPYKILPAGKKFVVKNNAGEVKATFDTRAQAVDYLKALYANVPGAQKRAAKVPFTGNAKNRAPVQKACLHAECARTFTNDTAFLTHVQTMHPELGDGAADVETAPVLEESVSVGCYDPDCERAFRDFDRMSEHATRVHSGQLSIERAEALLTFDDTRRIVYEEIREQFGRVGDPLASPPVPSVCTWIEDLAVDWVVYSVDDGTDCDLFKASYSIVDGSVTLGEPVEVQRRTVYEPVPASDEE